jgi:large subunit ribosomal protein L25
MSMQVALNAQKRDGSGKGVARKLRASGHVPAVLYGGTGESIALSLNTREAERLFRSVSVENTIIELSVEGGETVQTLVREIQTHPYRNEVVHVDFLRLQKGVAVEVNIPVHFVGTPVGVKDEGGVLDHVLHDVHIRCIPSRIPDSAELDVSGLSVGQSLHVSDLSFPEGVEILTDASLTVCAVHPPRVVEETESTGDEDLPVTRLGEPAEDE